MSTLGGKGGVAPQWARWAHANLFSSPLNIALTALSVWILWVVLVPLVQWALVDASFSGSDRSVCDANPDGACWTFIRVRFLQIMFGLYFAANPEQVWRPVLALGLLVALAWPLFVESFRHKMALATGLLLVFPFVGFALIHGAWLGLDTADTSQWGGLMLTFVLASIGIVGAFPLGVVLALGRRSEMVVIRSLSVFYIELIRGTPLITWLFMASVMLPLFFPSEVDFDKVARALVAITMFQAAYTAEAIRGGLQAIPKGQFEGAQALGLGYWRLNILVVLPQALKIAIPGIVNSLIQLVKDTTLVSIIGLLDLLNMSRNASRSSEWIGMDREAYVFAAAIFFVVCYLMSRYSRGIERRLNVGHER